MKYNYLIIEDNPGAVKNLQTALKPHRDYKEIGVAHTLKKGIALAQVLNPHLIFLDVELGDKNGFDVIKEIRQHSGEIPFFIMITDYSKYAVDAVNKDVLYFLDKPVDPDELAVGLYKFQKRFAEIQTHISIKNSEGHFFIDTNSICYLEADSNTSKLYFDNGEVMVVTKTLKKMEEILPLSFIRTHKSYVVNKNYVKMLNTTQRFLRIQLTGKEKEMPVGASYLRRVRGELLVG